MVQLVEELGEMKLLERLHSFVSGKKALVGVGDDAAVIRVGKEQLLLSTDSLVEGVHFSFPWYSPYEVGKKAITVNVSDIVAMGGKAEYALVSLIVPPKMSLDVLDGIYKGISAAGKTYHVEVVGGNVSKGNQLVVDVTLVGSVQKKNLCLRKDAKPGDFIMVSGPLGGSAAGLALYAQRKKGFTRLEKLHRNPIVDVSFASGFLGSLHAMQDISDGLVCDLGHICKASKVGAVLYADNIPFSPDVPEAAKVLGKNPLDFALYGGEEYCLLFTVPGNKLSSVSGYLIGEITKKRGIRLYKQGKEKRLSVKGHDHFSV